MQSETWQQEWVFFVYECETVAAVEKCGLGLPELPRKGKIP